jgi:hypothetical protein
MFPITLNVNPALFERYKFHRIRFVYLFPITQENREDVFTVCKQVSKAIESKLPTGWWVMAYGLLTNGQGVDVIVVNKLNSLAPHLIHSVFLK